MLQHHSLVDLLLEDCTIEPLAADISEPEQMIRQSLQLDSLPHQSLSHWDLAHYAAVESWLLDYHPEPTAMGLELVQGYLEAIEHLIELEDGQRIEQLFLAEYPIDNCHISVCDFLHDRGYFAELAELGDRLHDYIEEKTKVKVWLTLGNAKRTFGYYSEAKVYFSKIISSAKYQLANVDHITLGNAYYGIGQCFISAGDSIQAKTYFLKQLNLAKIQNNILQIARAEIGLGLILHSSGNYRKSLVYMKSSYTKSRNSEDIALQLDATNLLGATYMMIGDAKRGELFLRELLDLAQKQQSKHYEWLAITNLGTNYLLSNDYENGISYHEEALKMSRDRRDPLGVEIVLSMLAPSYLRLNEFEKAINPLHLCLTHAFQTGDLRAQSYILALLSYGYARMQHPRKEIAFRAAKKGLKIARKIASPEQEAQCLGGLAGAYWCYGQHLTGILVYLQSMWVHPPWVSANSYYAFLLFLETIFPCFFKIRSSQ